MKLLYYSADKGKFFYPEFLYGLRKSLGGRNVEHYKPTYGGGPVAAREEGGIRDRMDDFDCIVIHGTAFRDRDFEYVLNKKTSAVKIFIDSFDDFFVRLIYRHPEIKYYMKRELYRTAPPLPYVMRWGLRHLYDLTFNAALTHNTERPSKWDMPIGLASKARYGKLHPLPLTVIPEKVRPAKDKVYDVSFLGHFTSPDRVRYVKALRGIGNEYGLKCEIVTSRSHQNMVSNAEYAKFLLGSKAGLSVRGVGFDTIRYWELPAYGTALLSQKIPLVIPDNFVDGDSALYFDTNEELRQRIQKYVAKSDEWREIARNGHRQFLKYHTPEKRAELILGLIR